MTPPSQKPDTAEMHAADVATFKADIAYLQKTFDAHDRKDSETQNTIFSKLDAISRLIWIAFGGVIVISGVSALISGYIIKILAQ